MCFDNWVTRRVTSGAVTADHNGAHEFTANSLADGNVSVEQSLVSCKVFYVRCKPLFQLVSLFKQV